MLVLLLRTRTLAGGDGGAGAAVADVSQRGLASSEKNRAKLGLGENWLCLTILQ